VTKLLVISAFFNAMMWMLTCALCQTLDIFFGFPSEILSVPSVGKLQDILIFQAKKTVCRIVTSLFVHLRGR
jgi:hypothetical protein